MSEKLAKPLSHVTKLLTLIDHKDPAKITWLEFVQWYESEGFLRDRKHDAGLHEIGVTRLAVAKAQNFKVNRSHTEH